MKILKSKFLSVDKWSILLVSVVLLIGAPLYAWGLSSPPKDPVASELTHSASSVQPKAPEAEGSLEAENKDNAQTPPMEGQDKSASKKSESNNSPNPANPKKSEAVKKTDCSDANRRSGEKYLGEVQKLIGRNLTLHQNLSKEVTKLYDDYLKEVKSDGCSPSGYKAPDLTGFL